MDPLHQPVTLFMPTDTAMAALAQEQKDYLYAMHNRDQLAEYLRYHILRDIKVGLYLVSAFHFFWQGHGGTRLTQHYRKFSVDLLIHHLNVLQCIVCPLAPAGKAHACQLFKNTTGLRSVSGLHGGRAYSEYLLR